MGGEETTIIMVCCNPYTTGGGSNLLKITTCDTNPNDLSWNHSVLHVFFLGLCFFVCFFIIFFLRTVE